MGKSESINLVAKPETWDAVAETYHTELEESDYRLADDIENILKQHGLMPGDSLIEMGCGSGHLSACLAQKGYRVTLVDFSSGALEKAKLTFEYYNLKGTFIKGDLFTLDESAGIHDYAWNSGVMEHFGDDEITALMQNIARFAKKGVLYLVPNSTSIAYLLMRARLMSEDKWTFGEEYLRTDYDLILKRVGYKNIRKTYVSTASVSAYQIWQAEKKQGNISELYKRLAEENMLPETEGYLVSYYASDKNDEASADRYTGNTIQETRLFDLVSKKIGFENLQSENIQLKDNINEYIQKIETSDIKVKNLTKENDEYICKIEEYICKISEYESRLDDYEKKISDYSSENARNLSEIKELKDAAGFCKDLLQQKNEYIVQAQALCKHFATGKLMKLNHLLFRIKAQLLKGNNASRKEFWSWLNGRIRRTNRSLGEGIHFNPLMVIDSKLSEALTCGDSVPFSTITASGKETECNPVLPDTIKNILSKDYIAYDVIILSVIDYDFRHQRPQHFATRFAANGHRVFYVNANFIRPDSVTLKDDNLYVVDFANKEYNAIYAMEGQATLNWMKEKLTGLINTQAIRDAVIIADYPNWVYAAEYMRKQFGFKIITDYMDDYTGFLGTAEEFLKDNCIRLLQESNLVIASSQFLYDVACQYTSADKITIIRNGTEINHFYQAIGLETDKARKVIGYYGAVAHWFAWEKVCYLAESMPECDIVIIGAVTEHHDKLAKYDNIKLLGEKPYNELPQYLANFDVCLIPFDTSTDLIKATNPVKFYEYLSAGKKIVATEIPELMPFRNEYVYMSNNDKKFAEYVKACLDGTDDLKGKEECIAFAKENDWQRRFEHFEQTCRDQIPMVSVIVLTYNNLDLNKNCINSILNQTAYANYELIIVDNQSTDGTVEYLQRLKQQKLSNVTIIFNNENTGFAGGNNIGIREAKGDYVLLLNNDTEITRGWLTAMTKHLENNPDYGMCNPVTNSIGNESKIVVDYSNRQEMVQFAYSYTMKHMGEEYKDVDRLPLFATLIRKEVIEKAGYLNEEYKIGMFEDDDYTERVLHSGYKIVIAEDAYIHHVNNASFKKLDDATYKRIFEENKKIFETKWNKKWTMPKYREGVSWDSNKLSKTL